MFIPQKYEKSEIQYVDYSRECPRRSTRERSQPVRYQCEMPMRTRSRSRSRSARNRSSSKVRQQSGSPGDDESGNAEDFEKFLSRPGFSIGCIRAPTMKEVSTLCRFVIHMREKEIEVCEQISGKVSSRETREVFQRVITNLKKSLDPDRVKREDCRELMQIPEMADISLFVVYFFKMFEAIFERCRDVIYYSRPKISPEDFDSISDEYLNYYDNLKNKLRSAIDDLKMTGDSLKNYEKFMRSKN